MSARVTKPEQSRRSFLGSSAAMAAALTATGAPAVATEGPFPDADLLALEAQLSAVEARLQAIEDQWEEVIGRTKYPMPIEAVRWQPQDRPTICIDHVRKCERHGNGDDAVYAYGAEFAKELSETLAWWKEVEGDPAVHGFSKRSVERAEEILAGIEIMNAKNRAAEDASGYTALIEAEDAELDARVHLLIRVLATPATTIEGLLVKAKIALGFLAKPTTEASTSAILTHLARSSVEGKISWEHTASFALSADVARIGGFLSAAKKQDAA